MSKKMSNALKKLSTDRLKSKNYFPSAASVRKLHLSDNNSALTLPKEAHQNEKQTHTCVKPTSELTPTTFKELKINTVAMGKYIILRNLEECVFHVGWHTVVEDMNGDVCFLSFYNYPILEVPCVGDVLIVKEPLFLNTKRKVFCIKVDSPTDIIILSPSHRLHSLCNDHKWQQPLEANHEASLFAWPVPATNLEWFNRGSSFFNSRLYPQARDAYLLSLKSHTDHDNYWKEANMALSKTYSILGYYERARFIIRQVLHEFPKDDEILAEYGKVIIKLRMHLKTGLDINRFMSSSPEYLNFKRFKLMLETTESYTHEVVIQFITKHFETFDTGIGFYLGPITCIKGCRKGMSFAVTKAIPPNTLLMTGKALATVICNFEDGFDYSVDSLCLVPKVAQLIKQNPFIYGKGIYKLPKSKDEEVVSFNKSDCNEVEPICHMNVIRDICIMNAMAIEQKDDFGIKRIIGCALYSKPSFINHCCIPTVSIKFYNDMIFVYSINSMKEGDELLLSYVPVSQRMLPKQRRKLLAVRGITCQCNFCIEACE